MARPAAGIVPPRRGRGGGRASLELASARARPSASLAKAAQNPTFSFIAFCAAAEIALARGEPKAIAKQVERMLLVKELGGFHSSCGWRTPMMRDVLAFALTHGLRPETARRWIREKRVAPPVPRPPGWPMAVRIAVAEGLEVDLESAAPAPGAKSARKLRELLAVLIVERTGATQADLADWLWPDAEGDRALASLKVATHRLRQWLGEGTVRVQDGRTRLNPELVDCDLWRGASMRAERVLYGFDLPPVDALRKRLARGEPAA
jgi:hypothetical protein